VLLCVCVGPSIQQLDNADTICNKIDNLVYRGECKYFQILPHLKDITDEKISLTGLFNHCQKIEDPPWRSECFFVIADELVLLPDVENYFEEIEYACTHFNIARDYNYIDHTAVYIPFNNRLAYCNSLDSIESKEECFVSYGYGTVIHEDIDYYKMLKNCNDQDGYFAEACYSGIMWRLRVSSIEPEKFFHYCELAP